MRRMLSWRTGLQRTRLFAGALFLLAALGGCASMVPQTVQLREAWPAGVPPRAELDAVPFFPQEAYQCGPAALATTLVHAGVPVTPDALVPLVYLPGREGSLQVEMLAGARRHDRVAVTLAPRLDDLLREVAAGNPVIVLQDLGLGPVSVWHYAVVVGYDYPAGELILRSGTTRRQTMPFTVFEVTWKKSGYWAMLTLPPERLARTATEAGSLAAIAAMERVAQPRAADIAYTAFLERWPESEGGSLGLANVRHAQGARDDAEHILRRALGRHPDSVPVLNNLAQTLSDLGRNDEALPLIERALRAGGPHAGAVGETRALILQRLSRTR